MIVDDAVVIRKILSDSISSDPDITVVGTAPNGKIALQKLSQLNPDVITLDIEMPELNGIDTLKELRKIYPKLPVIMFSTLTAKGAATTLDALAAGASDYVTKPANVGSVTAARETVERDLIAKIKALAPRAASPRPLPTPINSPTKLNGHAAPALATKRPEIVTIGVSTGGPNALAAVIPLLPKNFSVPIVIVQHMPPMFTKLLADRLNAQSQIPINEAVDNEVIQPGRAYIAPGDFHLELKSSGGVVISQLTKGPPENSCRPAADVLFRSVVSIYGAATLGVVLTGMGSDGLRGCEKIKEAGGRVIVQDQASSIVWGMPGCVAEAGLANQVLPLDAIAQALTLSTSGNITRTVSSMEIKR